MLWMWSARPECFHLIEVKPYKIYHLKVDSSSEGSGSLLCNLHSCSFRNLSIAMEDTALWPLAAYAFLPAFLIGLFLTFLVSGITHWISVLLSISLFIILTRLSLSFLHYQDCP